MAKTTMKEIHEQLEPLASNSSVNMLEQPGLAELAALSSAISLKRIADIFQSVIGDQPGAVTVSLYVERA